MIFFFEELILRSQFFQHFVALIWVIWSQITRRVHPIILVQIVIGPLTDTFSSRHFLQVFGGRAVISKPLVLEWKIFTSCLINFVIIGLNGKVKFVKMTINECWARTRSHFGSMPLLGVDLRWRTRNKFNFYIIIWIDLFVDFLDIELFIIIAISNFFGHVLSGEEKLPKSFSDLYSF